MLSAEENRLVTETGPGTPAGAVLRRYWQPAALSVELEGERPVRPVTLMGERLVLFRDEDGTLGLIGRHCPHRGADLCFGRLEDGGLRCPFHGWLFDSAGACLEQPAEPEGSRFHEKIRHASYPVQERNGIIFAYLGSGEPPALPDIDCLNAPESHAFAFKGLIECNWLQALEVGIDPAHASFLHRFEEEDAPDERYGKQFRDVSIDSDLPMTRVLREYPRPKITVEDTDYGLRLTALRDLDGSAMHVRVTNQLFPTAIVIPMSADMSITQWHVPVDDVTCYWYAIFTSFSAPVDHATMREQRLELYELPDYIPKIGKRNDYGFDAEEQRSRTYTGMGEDINVHDQWAVESLGAIQDRTQEHLGATDIGITAYRKKLRKAIRALTAEANGEAVKADDIPPALPRENPLSVDCVAPIEGWQARWRATLAARRAGCPWLAEAAE